MLSVVVIFKSLSQRKHDLLMSSEFRGIYRCEQLFSSMKNAKLRTGTRLTDGHLEKTCESQQKLNLILKDYSRKGSVRYFTDD
jgi:hypothetical protein